ncbi:hypothetical protein UFOVP257_429 [uncultured Caudovirales phage]|uniref:Uncharacterized protein n=1 Tax=uncultured Caudovirales phage TaxID=2100421 RepID=A0A6J5LKV1_9CAUD|nr:hypothetical protein UFOVP257_429 [uncultured Caudovirales phage]
MSQHKEQQGYLTIAANTADTDYLRLAYLQALNIKDTQQINRYAVIVDTETAKLITDEHRKVFDYIIETEPSVTGTYGIEPLVFWLTPFKETIKVESDLLFTRSIDHWWNTFRLRDVVLSSGCRDYTQEIATSRKYRKLFDDNHLPDTYNGLMYFRFSQTAATFFRIARTIYEQWNVVADFLLNCRDNEPTTDVVYALVANIIGRELCTIPSADFINFVHMKPSINGYPEDMSFKDVFVSEFDKGMIRINNINQYHPLHYHDKTFVTNEMIEYYESRRILG